jgi:Fe-S-cluster containining protein
MIPISDFSETESQHGDELREAQAETTREMIRAGASATELANNASGFAEGMAKKLLSPLSPPTACARGCSACCYQQVTVLAPEVIRIIDFLKSSFLDEARKQLIDRLKNLDLATRGLSATGRAKIPKSCAFLENNECTIYPVRPMSCAEFTSYKLSDCKKGKRIGFKYGSVIHEKARMLAYYSVQQGFKKGIEQGNPKLDHSWLELTSAIVDALRIENSENEWANGGSVFEKSRMEGGA